MTTPEAALANALHDVDDDVQFIRRDARNLPVLSARTLAALHDAGYALTPLAPEVPPPFPVSDDDADTGRAAAIGASMDDGEAFFYRRPNGSLVPLVKVRAAPVLCPRCGIKLHPDDLHDLHVRDLAAQRLAATRTPEPPDSGPDHEHRYDGALHPPLGDEPPDSGDSAAGIDAETIHRWLMEDDLLPDCSGTHLMGYGTCQRLYARLRSGSPAPEGGE